MINEAIVSGNLTKDPYIGDGKWGKYAFFTVASNWKFGDKEGADYVSCSASSRVAESLSSFKKGDNVLVVGKVKSKKSKDGSGTELEVKANSVWMLPDTPSYQAPAPAQPAPAQPEPQTKAPTQASQAPQTPTQAPQTPTQAPATPVQDTRPAELQETPPIGAYDEEKEVNIGDIPL